MARPRRAAFPQAKPLDYITAEVDDQRNLRMIITRDALTAGPMALTANITAVVMR
jgi:hypothetical protein